MTPHPDRILFRELPMVAKVIRDETWLEGERRGGPVSPEDPVVRENVCRVILRIGAEMREMCSREIGSDIQTAA
ncbi:MAG: hypothetical protein ABIZ49_09210 [Opitutaceae bacterium]